MNTSTPSSTANQPQAYPSCFISYSSQDETLSKKLYADLQANGVTCWFAPHNLIPGDHFREKIEQAIGIQDKLLLILSQESVQSHWVAHEVRRAINREVNQNTTILFLIRIDDTLLTNASPWAKDLRENRYIGNFTEWIMEAVYQEKLATLLQQLKESNK